MPVCPWTTWARNSRHCTKCVCRAVSSRRHLWVSLRTYELRIGHDGQRSAYTGETLSRNYLKRWNHDSVDGNIEAGNIVPRLSLCTQTQGHNLNWLLDVLLNEYRHDVAMIRSHGPFTHSRHAIICTFVLWGLLCDSTEQTKYYVCLHVGRMEISTFYAPYGRSCCYGISSVRNFSDVPIYLSLMQTCNVRCKVLGWLYACIIWSWWRNLRRQL